MADAEEELEELVCDPVFGAVDVRTIVVVAPPGSVGVCVIVVTEGVDDGPVVGVLEVGVVVVGVVVVG